MRVIREPVSFFWLDVLEIAPTICAIHKTSPNPPYFFYLFILQLMH